MGSIHKQPNGRWRARYRDPYNRTRSKTFARKADAQAFLDRLSVAMQHGEWVDPSLRRVTFGEWAEQWWATTAKLRPTTRRGYWLLLKNHVLPHFGDRAIISIDYLDVERFIADKVTAGLSSKHIREMVNVVSLVMRLAVRTNIRHDNPAAGHPIPKAPGRIRRSDVLTLEDTVRFVDCVLPYYQPAVWTLVFTGIRPSELCGLTVASLDAMHSAIHVSATLQPVQGFDGGRRTMVAGPPKTAAGERTIPIPRWLTEEIARSLASRAGAGSRTLAAGEPLFVNVHGEPINRDAFRAKVIRPALRSAGLPESLRTYDLRHGHASQLIDMGASVLAVAQRMGHTDPAVTLRVYGHLFEGTQERLTEQLEEALREVTSRTRRESSTPIRSRRQA